MLVAKECTSCGAPLPQGGLQCGFCGSTHVVTSAGLRAACSQCGTGNPPDAKSCVECSAKLVSPCPECAAANPLGCRFCKDCGIEFRTYREAACLYAPNTISEGEVEGLSREWLETRWFKARDLADGLKILRKTLVWLPLWDFRARAVGHVQGQVSHTHYKTETKSEWVTDPAPDPPWPPPPSDPHEGLVGFPPSPFPGVMGSSGPGAGGAQSGSQGSGGRWVERTHSVPYEVKQEVSKRFDQGVDLHLRASGEADQAYDFLGEPWKEEQRLLPLEDSLGGEDWECVFPPDAADEVIFQRLRDQARADLRATLLDEVEMLEVQFRDPRLQLSFHPLWEVLYRYRGTHGTVRVDGASARIGGKRVSLLNQWFS
jgi:ribosomal protein L40E